MHKRSMLWAGAGVHLLSNPGFGAEEVPDAPGGDQAFPVPLASTAADCPPAVAPPGPPRRELPAAARGEDSP